MNEQAVDDASIILAYQLILGRSPESESAIQSHRHKTSIQELYETLFQSQEFKVRTWRQNYRFLTAAESIDTHGVPKSFGTGDRVTIFQTSDQARYIPLVRETSKTLEEFVRGRSAVSLETFIGLKKGYFPHHATFNRIYKLQEYVKLGVEQWVMYMDADSYLVDMHFDLNGWLGTKCDKAFLFARCNHDTTNYWDVNAGLFFANLAHPMCREIIAAWVNFYETFYTDDDYKTATQWDSVINDQTSLQSIISMPACEPFIQSDSSIRSVINCAEASFARQVLRSDASAIDQTLDERLNRIKVEVARVLGGD